MSYNNGLAGNGMMGWWTIVPVSETVSGAVSAAVSSDEFIFASAKLRSS